jgi:hypothetical protein
MSTYFEIYKLQTPCRVVTLLTGQYNDWMLLDASVMWGLATVIILNHSGWLCVHSILSSQLWVFIHQSVHYQ